MSLELILGYGGSAFYIDHIYARKADYHYQDFINRKRNKYWIGKTVWISAVLHDKMAYGSAKLPSSKESYIQWGRDEIQKLIGTAGVSDTSEWWLRVPFLIPLRVCPGSRLPELDRYPNIGTDYPLSSPPGWVQSVIEAGRALILIDGIDEIPKADRPQIKSALEAFCRIPQGNYVILTTRPGVTEEDWFSETPMMRAEINPLSEPERNLLIEHWHKAAAEQLQRLKQTDDASGLAPVLIEKLRQAPHIAQLGTNPLLCAAICALHYGQRGYLPRGQVDLCKQLCELLIHKRDLLRGVPESQDTSDYGLLDYRHKEVIIQALAQAMVRAGAAAIERDEAEALIESKLGNFRLSRPLDPAFVRERLVERTGLLREAYGGAIDFAHNTLRDFLAAQNFAAEPTAHRELARNVHDETWRRVITFAAASGGANFASRLIEALLAPIARTADAGQNFGPAGRMRLIAALLCDASVTDLDVNLRARIQRLREHAFPPQSMTEADALAALGKEVVPLLTYRGEDAAVAAATVRCLRLIGTEQATEALRSHFDDAREIVAEELAFAFNPLEIPYWRAVVTQDTPVDIEFATALWAFMAHVTPVPKLPEAIARRVTDLRPIASAENLRNLWLSGTAIQDIDLLRNLNGLEHLALDETGIFDLDSVSCAYGLRAITANRTAIKDLEPLNKLKRLELVSVAHTGISDLTPLRKLDQLKVLTLAGTSIQLLEAIVSLRELRYLDLNFTKITDFTPLSRFHNLRGLSLVGTSIADLRMLRKLTQLEFLSLIGTRITDLEPLSEMKNLMVLSIPDTKVRDLKPLQSIKGLRVVGAPDEAKRTAPSEIRVIDP